MSAYKDKLKQRWQSEREGGGITGQVVSEFRDVSSVSSY